MTHQQLQQTKVELSRGDLQRIIGATAGNMNMWLARGLLRGHYCREGGRRRRRFPARELPRYVAIGILYRECGLPIGTAIPAANVVMGLVHDLARPDPSQQYGRALVLVGDRCDWIFPGETIDAPLARLGAGGGVVLSLNRWAVALQAAAAKIPALTDAIGNK